MNKFVITRFVPKDPEEEEIAASRLHGGNFRIKKAREPSDFEGKTTAIECSGELFDKKELLELVEEVYKSRTNTGAEWMDFANEMEKRLKC